MDFFYYASKFIGGGGGRGDRVSKFFLQRTQIRIEKNFFFFFFFFFLGRGGGVELKSRIKNNFF